MTSLPGDHGADGRLGRRVDRGDTGHAHRIGVDQSAEAEVLAQQSLDDRPAQRRRRIRLGIERRHLDVRGHDRVGAGGDSGAKGRQLHLVEPLARLLDDRQAEMRIHIGVAVPGKVFERCRHACRLQSANVGGRKTSDHGRILTIRSGVDDRVARIVVHVDDRREVHVNAEGARFLSGDASGFLRQLFVPGRAECHQARE